MIVNISEANTYSIKMLIKKTHASSRTFRVVCLADDDLQPPTLSAILCHVKIDDSKLASILH